MRILNENDEEITKEQVDLEVGYLKPDQVFKEHHDAIPYKPEEWHYVVRTFYFTDGTSLRVDNEGDPHIVKIDPENGVFGYQGQEGDPEREVKGIDLEQITDQKQQQAEDEWDEYEDIQRYILYTEEELAEKKKEEEEAEKRETFMETGPDRLTGAETNIEDLSVSFTELVMATMSL